MRVEKSKIPNFPPTRDNMVLVIEPGDKEKHTIEEALKLIPKAHYDIELGQADPEGAVHGFAIFSEQGMEINPESVGKVLAYSRSALIHILKRNGWRRK